MSYETVPDEFDKVFHQISWLIFRIIKNITGWKTLTSKRKKEVEGQNVREEDYIYRELYTQGKNILVDDTEPDTAKYKIHGVIVKKKIVHNKSEPKNGADLYLEIEGEKFAFIQFKRPIKKGRFVFSKKQFKDLSVFCVFCSKLNQMPPQCPALIWLIDDTGFYTKHRIFRLCEIQGILGKRMSAHKDEFFKQHGIYRSTYAELFVNCWIGARFNHRDMNDLLVQYSRGTNRMVIHYTLAAD